MLSASPLQERLIEISASPLKERLIEISASPLQERPVMREAIFCFPFTFIRRQVNYNLNFYDVDKEYIKYLKNIEIQNRGFTHVPDMEYKGEQKFLCGIVLKVSNNDYYVPVSSYKEKKQDNILIIFKEDKYNPVKGSLRFNYMFPVPQNLIKLRVINDEQNNERKRFLNRQLLFCNEESEKIFNQANRTYTIVTKGLNPNLIKNSCDFILLEKACIEYHK